MEEKTRRCVTFLSSIRGKTQMPFSRAQKNVRVIKKFFWHLSNADGLSGSNMLYSLFLCVRRILCIEYIPLINSSHDASWGPERQLSCEDDTEKELIWFLHLWMS